MVMKILLKKGSSPWLISSTRKLQKLSSQVNTWISMSEELSNKMLSSIILIKRTRMFWVSSYLYRLVICSFEQVKESLKASMKPFKHYYALILTCLFSSTRNRNNFFKNKGRYLVLSNSLMSSMVLIQSIRNDLMTGCEWTKFSVRMLTNSS